jgi:DNA polymerase-3 subunit alpha
MHSQIDITTVPENDTDVWKMIGEGRVKGCFQIESHLGKTWCQKLKPENMTELAALISIIRPGTLKAIVDGKSMTQHFVDRKHKQEEIPSLHPLIDDMLKETYGVIVYQEQAMEISVKMAGFNLKEADDLRKAIGKKKADLMKEVRIKFINGCNKNAIDEDKSIEIFDMIEKSARYSFNKSHAVAYAKMAYWSAWVKYHYPEKFFKNWLRNADEKIDPDFEKRQLIMSAKSEDITVRGPSIKVLEENFSWQDGCIYFGICNVKNVGKAHLVELQNHLNNLTDNEKTWTNILVKTLPNINKRAVENLIQTGAFSGFGKSRSEMLHEFHCYLDFTKKEIEAIKQNINCQDATVSKVVERFVAHGLKKNGGFISTQSRLDKVQNILLRINNPGRSLIDNGMVYAKIEEKLLGYSINHSELNSCSEACHANTTCKQITDGKTDDSIIAAVIKKIREYKTKNGDLMAFLSIEDDSGELENIVVFPDIYEQNKDIMYEQATVLLSGKIQDKGRNSFIVDKVFLI